MNPDQHTWLAAHQGAVQAEDRLFHATRLFVSGEGSREEIAELSRTAKRLRARASQELAMLLERCEARSREINHAIPGFELAVKVAKRSLHSA